MGNHQQRAGNAVSQSSSQTMASIPGGWSARRAAADPRVNTGRAHPPIARASRRRIRDPPLVIRRLEAEPVHDGGRPRLGAVTVDGLERCVRFGRAPWPRRRLRPWRWRPAPRAVLCLRPGRIRSRRADSRRLPVRHGRSSARRALDVSAVGVQIAADCRKQARLARAVAPVRPALSPRKTVKLTARTALRTAPQGEIPSRQQGVATKTIGKDAGPSERTARRGGPLRRSGSRECRQFTRFHGIAEQAPLGVIAAVLAQELELVAVLDPFGDDLEIEALAMSIDGAGRWRRRRSPRRRRGRRIDRS